MLNVTTRIRLSSISKRHIKNLKRSQNGNFTSISWSDIRSSVKNEISAKLLANQGLKCAYCERYLIGLGHEIDHFVHKGDYPQFSFIAINLFYSCKHCNSPERKGQKNTIRILDNNYSNCTFLIVHPFLHNPETEIVFLDADKIIFDRTRCTQLGSDTIDLFGWDDLMYSLIRSRDLVKDRLAPLTSEIERQLIQKAISYKKRK